METIEKRPNDLIKEASKGNHQQLEKKVISMLKDMKDDKGYFLLLNVFYNYFNALEAKIGTFISADILPDIAERRKAAHLAADIKALGFGIIAYTNIETPEISSPLEALAALYVMEGSTLGGSVIVKMLQQKGIDKGISFFSGYGHQTFQKWQVFLEVLNAFPETDTDTESVIKTVKDTFDCFYGLLLQKTIELNLS